ncbi:MAG: RNA methyltransferase [Pseudomonadota bacterium]
MKTAVRFVLVRPEYPSNIGASARALKTMGFRDLWLVRPRRFPHPEATRLATEAADVLDEARVAETLDEALADCALTIATSGRQRGADWPLVNVAEAGALAARAGGPVAVVFGPEPSGLTNDELYRCRYQATIDTSDDCSSLNLAQAVQIFAYELRRSLVDRHPASSQDEPATDAMLEHLYAGLEATVERSGFARYEPRHLLLRFRRALNRADLTAREASMFTGLFAKIAERLRP